MNSILRMWLVSSVVIVGAVLFTACDGGGDGGGAGGPDGGADGGADGGSDGGSTVPGGLATRWLAFDSNRATFNRDIYLVRGDGSQLTRLTTDPSVEEQPAFSHDGASLAFVSDRSGSMQIHGMSLATGEVKQLTSLAAGADEPSWSNDDSQILFHSGRSIYVMNVDGSNPKVLATGPDSYNAYEYPSVSLDGTEVLCSRGNEVEAWKLKEGTQRYIVKNWTTTEETPALSPDGRLVAYAAGCGLLEVIAVTPFFGLPADPCGTLRVTPDAAGSARRPTWAANDTLAFERSATSSRDMWTAVISVIQSPGGPFWDIVGPPGDNRNPSWAPVGFQPSK